MKSSVRNAVLTVLCGAMVAGAGACSTEQKYPVTIDGESLRAGTYILQQQSAMSEAASKLSEEQPDLDMSAEDFSYLNYTVEGKKFEDWVNEKALENCREYVAVERLFDSYGLSATSDELKEINDNVKQLWSEENMYAQYYYGVSIVGEYYEKFGVGEQSFREYQTNSLKRSKIFEHLYGEGGELAATQDEINTALNTDYLAVNYFPYELENGDSAQSFADRISSGETYEAVYRDYAQALTDEEAAKAAEEAENTYASESNISTDEADTSDDASEEEAADGEASETAPVTVEEAEKDSLIQIIKKDSATPSQSFIDQVSAMNSGEVKVITVEGEAATRTYVVQKLDILSLPEKTEATIDTIRSDLKTDEFNEMLKTTGAGYSLTTDSSIGLYKVEKLIEK